MFVLLRPNKVFSFLFSISHLYHYMKLKIETARKYIIHEQNLEGYIIHGIWMPVKNIFLKDNLFCWPNHHAWSLVFYSNHITWKYNLHITFVLTLIYIPGFPEISTVNIIADVDVENSVSIFFFNKIYLWIGPLWC